MAEALQLGVDVIATAYGGNTDFCSGPLAHPVRCQEVPIPRGAYPCADDHVWGEPDLDHAAELMQQVAARRLALAKDHEAAATDPSRDPSVQAIYRERFSFATVGARYRARLEVSLPRFQGQCLESCFYTDPMKTNDHNECPFYATPLQR